MHWWSWNRSMVFCAGLAVAAAGTSSASVLSYQGVFTTDSQTETFSFVAASTGVVIQTESYAGGLNASGKVIARGGFDPSLSLFGPGPVLSPNTPLIGVNDDGNGAATDPFTGAAFDSILDTTAASIPLIPGQTYFVVLSQSGNFPNTNSYGGGFSGIDTSIFGCSNAHFCDVTGDNRDGHWALDILGALVSSDTSFPLPLAPSPFIPGPIGPADFSFFSISGDPGPSGNPLSSGPLGNNILPGPNNAKFITTSDCTGGSCGGSTDQGSSGGQNPGNNSQVSTAGDVNADAPPIAPEPASAILFGAAIAGALLVRRRAPGLRR